MEQVQQVWYGSVVLSDDRGRHKLNAEDFMKEIEVCSSIKAQSPVKYHSGLSAIKMHSDRFSAGFNVLYQDLRSGDKAGDKRKRLQVSKVSLKSNEQYFYVTGYNAGDKRVYIAFLTNTREINSVANISSRWIDWEPFYKVYTDGVNLWSKNGISYLGCTNENLEVLFSALATRALDNYVPVSVPAPKTVKYTQKIFFGAPGTGKSHKVKIETMEMNVHRTTFHPDTDYASFVGAYKPTQIETPVRDYNGQIVSDAYEKKIVYQFSPQIFANAYCEAWNEYLKPTDVKAKVCLLIEELNRGNCAQIFGDLFQLLDRSRKTGFSEYSIVAEEEFAKHVCSEIKDFKAYYNAIRDNSDIVGNDEKSIAEWSDNGNNKVLLSLPPNLSVVCTMNTSDQSLFPMDTAFKRRWDWEYVPIEYDNEESDFIIVVDEYHKYSWPHFLKTINEIIYDQTKSEDKQMGNFFVLGDESREVDYDQFVSKVMFFLWSEVCKDNPKARKTIFVAQETFSDTNEQGGVYYKDFAFKDLFQPYDAGREFIYGFMLKHGVENIAEGMNLYDPSEVAGEDKQQKLLHTLYLNNLYECIENSSGEFKQNFPSISKPHNNYILLDVDFGGSMSLSRTRSKNIVCYGHPDVGMMKRLKDGKGYYVREKLGVPNEELNQYGVSRWKFNNNNAQVKLVSDHKQNCEEEYKWFMETAMKFYNVFKDLISNENSL
jgi:hypothetical protein